MGWFELVSVAGVAASIAGAILAWQTWDTKKFLERLDARHLAQHTLTQGILERMDRANEQRAELLKTLVQERR